VVDIWGFLLMNPYWLLQTFSKTPNINHATTTGLESAFKKHPNPTVPELIEKLLELIQNWNFPSRSSLYRLIAFSVMKRGSHNPGFFQRAKMLPILIGFGVFALTLSM
jgi:hypothetical protein